MQLDSASLSELQVLDAAESTSLVGLIDRTATAGGRARLLTLLNAPLDSVAAIEQRQAALRFLDRAERDLQFGYVAARCEEARAYIESRWQDLPADPLRCEVTSILHRAQYRDLSQGLLALARLLSEARRISRVLAGAPAECTELHAVRATIDEAVAEDRIAALMHRTRDGTVMSVRTATLDGTMRERDRRHLLREVLGAVYLIDAFRSMAHPPAGFNYPTVLEQEAPGFEATGLFHPLLEQPVPVDLSWQPPMRLLFLSGPNMSGKTTLMRAAGLTVYLAHLGMAVPAERATLSLFARLFAVMTMRDSLDRGESFYLSEVRRVAALVTGLQKRERTFAMIDEAFKGTNVSDAREGTMLLARGLACCPDGLFLVASHLTEAAHDLAGTRGISFAQMSTTWEGEEPHFSYRLAQGVSELRLGLTILEREGVAPALRGFIEGAPEAIVG